MPSGRKGIRIDEPAPTRVIISALEVIQPGLYGAYLAAGAKMGEEEMEITGATRTIFIVLGEGLPLPGFDLENTRALLLCTLTPYPSLT